MRSPLGGVRTSGLVTAMILAIGACSSPVATTAVNMLAPAGPAMNKDAPVTLQGSSGSVTQVGKVVETETRPDRNVLHLSINSDELHLIPANVTAKVEAPTAVHLILPINPAPQQLQAGVVLEGQ
jgi:ABC-type transporter Mla subunit MlaD